MTRYRIFSFHGSPLEPTQRNGVYLDTGHYLTSHSTRYHQDVHPPGSDSLSGNIRMMCMGYLNFFYFLSNSLRKHWNTYWATRLKQHRPIFSFHLFSEQYNHLKVVACFYDTHIFYYKKIAIQKPSPYVT